MKPKEKTNPRHNNRFCPACKKLTMQTVALYNPDDPNGGEVWYCTSCKENVEWYKKGKS